jgi:predicted transcriptional regulator
MKAGSPQTSVLTIRVPRSLDRRLTAEARRLRRTRSEAARAILEDALTARTTSDPVEEARRQSLLASGRESDADALDFVSAAADIKGWE